MHAAGENHASSSDGPRGLLWSSTRKLQIKPCTTGISWCPFVFPLQHPLSLVPKAPWCLGQGPGTYPSPAGGQERGTGGTAPPPTEGSCSNVTCAISRALVLLVPVIFWLFLAGADDRRGCCYATPQGSWEHRGQEEEEEEGGAGWVVGTQANTCISLGGSVSRREDLVSRRLVTNPRFNICLAISCKGVKPVITKPVNGGLCCCCFGVQERQRVKMRVGRKGLEKEGDGEIPPGLWHWAALTAQIPTQLLSQGEFPTAAELLCALREVPIIQKGSGKTRSIPEGRKIQEIPSPGGPSPSSALADHSACFALALFSTGP